MIRKKQKFIDSLLILIFIISLNVGTISNYSSNSLFIKIVINALLLFAMIADYRLNNIRYNDWLSRVNSRNIIFAVVLITLEFSVSWNVSVNPNFGIQKIIQFFIGNIPAIIAVMYVILFKEKNFLHFSSNILAGICLISTFMVVLLNPFNYETPYSFELFRWSHVILGRFLGMCTILFALNHFTVTKFKEIFINGSIIVILIFGVYFTNLRAAYLVVILLMPLIFLFVRPEKKRASTQRLSLLLFASLSLLVIVIHSSFLDQAKTSRIENMFEFIQLGNKYEGEVSARLSAYEIAAKSFEKDFILGSGLGSFNSEKIAGDFNWLKYPHNIILELLIEHGIIGLLLFGWLFWNIVRAVLLYDYRLLFLLAAAFIFSLFSKDIATQPVLWIWTAFLMINKKDVQHHVEVK
ncbi:MAG: O-antigen ligase family protein [Bacteroidetes bacterium]|nr:O-antigen ligase family protein [Bacteroidota bacterium]